MRPPLLELEDVRWLDELDELLVLPPEENPPLPPPPPLRLKSRLDDSAIASKASGSASAWMVVMRVRRKRIVCWSLMLGMLSCN